MRQFSTRLFGLLYTNRFLIIIFTLLFTPFVYFLLFLFLDAISTFYSRNFPFSDDILWPCRTTRKSIFSSARFIFNCFWPDYQVKLTVLKLLSSFLFFFDENFTPRFRPLKLIPFRSLTYFRHRHNQGGGNYQPSPNGYTEQNSPNNSTDGDATLISRTQKQHTTQQVKELKLCKETIIEHVFY